MRRWYAAVAVAVALAALPVGAAADQGAGESAHLGPFPTVADPDHGSCGNVWALDNFNRFLTVHDTGGGTFAVREDFKDGSFVTTDGFSPGACDNGSSDGHVVRAGVEGTFHGYLEGTVTGGILNPSGCSVPGADCTTTSGLIAAVFGGTATYDVTPFAFEYAAGAQDLISHHWEDRSDQRTGLEEFRGDIATG